MTDWRPIPHVSGARATPPSTEPGAGTASTGAAGTGALPAHGWGRRLWSRGRWVGAGAVVVLAAAALVVALHASSRPSLRRSDVAGVAGSTVRKAIADLEARPPAAVGVYDQAAPAVVIVRSAAVGGPGKDSDLGSGVVVNRQGEILTALHVVRGAASVKVSFPDGTDSAATVQSTDPAHDIAVLVPAHLPAVVVPAVLGGGAQVGDDVFAVGHPLGLVDTLTAGVVSGLNRSFQGPDGRTMTGLIQFDAAVNPGNSGGPLLNRQGQVIGIVTGLANPSGEDDFAGIAFAVPISTAGGAAGAPSK